MEEGLALGLGDAECPAPAIAVLRVVRDGLDALAEDVHRVAQPDLVPGVVVVDAVEGCDVGDILVQDVQSVVLVVVGVAMLVEPYRPAVLEWQRA